MIKRSITGPWQLRWFIARHCAQWDFGINMWEAWWFKIDIEMKSKYLRKPNMSNHFWMFSITENVYLKFNWERKNTWRWNAMIVSYRLQLWRIKKMDRKWHLFLPKKNMKNHPFPTVKRIRFINFTHDNLPPLGQPTPPSLCILYIYTKCIYIYISVGVGVYIYIYSVYTDTHETWLAQNALVSWFDPLAAAGWGVQHRNWPPLQVGCWGNSPQQINRHNGKDMGFNHAKWVSNHRTCD